MEQLQSLKDNSQSFVEKDKDHSKIWEDDIKALDEAMDIIYDYEKVIEQVKKLTEKHETSKTAIGRGMGKWQCSNCSVFIPFESKYCSNCGQKLNFNENIPKVSKSKKGKNKICTMHKL